MSGIAIYVHGSFLAACGACVRCPEEKKAKERVPCWYLSTRQGQLRGFNPRTTSDFGAFTEAQLHRVIPSIPVFPGTSGRGVRMTDCRRLEALLPPELSSRPRAGMDDAALVLHRYPSHAAVRTWPCLKIFHCRMPAQPLSRNLPQHF